MSYPLERIRNFSIIAHIDHGKSTLADRFIQICGGLEAREMSAQVLDSMDIERERGITIKAQSVSLSYRAADGEEYQLNFIDTPGHVDFSYEVSRSLAACEGALLVVDAAQGVEAQSVANCYTAIDEGLEVVPVLNKMDLPQADPDAVAHEIEEIIGIGAQDAVRCSAKSGDGVDEVIERLITRVPPPRGDRDAPLQALIIDSWFDPYVGVISLVRVMHGTLKPRDKMRVWSTGRSHQVDKVGIFTPKRTERGQLTAGEVGFVIAGIKEIDGAPVGDTLTLENRPCAAPLPGFKQVQPRVFAGLFPISSDDYEDFREALQKLKLNDAALHYEPENSTALGFGFRCGFLGMLHMEIVQERLEREFDLDLVTTVPNVKYHLQMSDGSRVELENPSAMPDRTKIEDVLEPYVRARIVAPSEYIGNVQKLCHERRGDFKEMHYLDQTRVEFVYELPLAEIVLDFYDKLKSGTRGYASLDWEFLEYRENDLVKLDMMINGDSIDAFSVIIHKDKAYEWGRAMAEKLRELIPRQMFEVAIQASIGGRIIARESIRAMRKNARDNTLLRSLQAGK